MKKRLLATVAAVLLSAALVPALLCLLSRISTSVSGSALASPPGNDPTVTEVDPTSASNDIDTPIVITGTGFAAELSGTLALTAPTVYLGPTSLKDVQWVSRTRLTAVVPWGLVSGTYSMTVVNPDGISGTLPGAFTVTQGLGVWTTGGPYGGPIKQLVLDPATPSKVYALAFLVGVFASPDGAANWEMILRDDWPTRVALDAGDPDVIYYGGESWGTLLRSMDGGVNWERLQESLPYQSAHGCYRAYPAAHPISTGVVYVGTGSCDGIPIEPGTGGVYRSSDYGSGWITMTSGLTDTDITDFAFHPDDPDRMLVGTINGHLFLSTDGGQHWNWRANLGSAVRRVYINPYGAHEAWAVLGRESGPTPYLYKSDDADLTAWTAITVTHEPGVVYPVNSLTFYSDTIWAAAYLGFTSTDGGASWSPVGRAGMGDDEVREFAIDPGDPNLVYAGCLNGGVYESNDGGINWNPANEGLAALLPQALAVPRGDPDTVYALTSELGVLKSNNGGRAWQASGGRAGGGAGPAKLAVDPFTSTRLYVGRSCPGTLCLMISEDAGTTWRDVTSTLPITRTGTYADVGVVAPHLLLPGRVLAGVAFRSSGGWSRHDAGGIFLSDDYGETWQYAWPPPTEVFSQVMGIVYDAFDPDLVYAGTGDTGLWRSTDAGVTWQAVSIPGVLPPVGIETVVAHPNISHTVYVRLYSHAATPNPEGQLFVSEDATASWTELEEVASGGGLWFAPQQREHPPYSLYTACGTGLCRSTGVIGANIDWEAVEGVPRPTSMAADTDGERLVVYIGTPGGVAPVEGQAVMASEPIPGRGSVMGGGVYRLTTRLRKRQMYLPLVLKGYAR